jgi:hypothetical protein
MSLWKLPRLASDETCIAITTCFAAMTETNYAPRQSNLIAVNVAMDPIALLAPNADDEPKLAQPERFNGVPNPLFTGCGDIAHGLRITPAFLEKPSPMPQPGGGFSLIA